MPKIRKNHVTILFIIVIMAVIAGYTYLLFIPNMKEMDILKNDLQAKEVQLSKATILAKNQERLMREISELENKVEQVKKELPKEKEIPQLLQRIDFTGKESDMDFLFFKPRPVMGKEFYGEVPIDLSVKGSFHNFGKFLNIIAGLPRLINISKMRINGVVENNEKITIKADMIAMTYIYMENMPAPAQAK